MKVIKTISKLCSSCMKEHGIQYVEVMTKNTFKEIEVEYIAHYEYCVNTEEFTTYNDTMNTNDVSFKNAYRVKVGLLTSKEIIDIRKQYNVSQKDFSKILGWGSSTITRYEGHHVQDGIHDDVLRKVKEDAKWFIELLERSKSSLSSKAYAKYKSKAKKIYYKGKNAYLIDSIRALYANFEERSLLTGRQELNLDKVVETINYLAKNIHKLHKVKLMKLLWFIDYLKYKRENNSLSGLAYKVLPMGAVPLGYEKIVLLEGVEYNEILYADYIGYEFIPATDFMVKNLNVEDLRIIDEVIEEFKDYTTQEIIDRMHKEEAYKKTRPLEIISYEYAKNLTLRIH